jgi:hypothetical protein
MKSKNIKILIACSIFTTTIMILMYQASPASAPIKPSTFTRNIDRDLKLSPISITKIGPNAYYFAGNTQHTYYMGCFKEPFSIFIHTTGSPKIEKKKIQLVNVDSITALENFRTKIDSPKITTVNGVMPDIFTGNLTDLKVNRFIKNNNSYFVDAYPISNTSFTLRSLSRISQTYQLAKLSSIDTPSFSFKQNILQKQYDGIMDVQGRICYDKISHTIAYVYSYRNEFIALDTNLEIKYRAKTIDTTSTAKFSVEKIKSTGTQIISSPPSNINAHSLIYNNRLYIESKTLSKNESLSDFISSTVIDVYDLKNGTYIKSIYIPKHKNIQANDFIVSKNTIAAIYNNILIIYKTNIE